jgi:hypothetical protein
MRGGDDARGHAREVRCAAFGFFAQVTRAFSRDVAECASERAETSPAGVECDLADGHLRVPQQRLGPLDAAREQVAVRRQSECLLELAREMRGGDVTHPGETRDGPFFMRSRVHAVLGAQQAAQELGVLVFWWCVHLPGGVMDDLARMSGGRK